MSSWVRRRFDGIGLTQSPPGRHLPALQARFGGTVLLCIDVSSSMSGDPLRQAIAGSEQFLQEAVAANYKCGLVLWNTGVSCYLGHDEPAGKVLAALRAARASGGTDLCETLMLGKRVFGPLTGDRVICIFGDGDVGNRVRVIELARELCAMGVRIVVRGLGPHAANALAELVCPGHRDEEQLIDDVDSIGAGIASMATGLVARRRP